MQDVSTHEPGTLRRFGPDRPMLRRAVVSAVVLAVTVGAAVFGVQIFGSDGGSSYVLAPGPTRAPSGFSSAALITHVSPQELVTESTTVFVGTVVGESEPESIGEPISDAAGQSLTVHPVHFAVERTLRGEAIPARDLIYPDFAGEVIDVFAPGDRLLVFGEVRSFGPKRITGLTALATTRACSAWRATRSPGTRPPEFGCRSGARGRARASVAHLDAFVISFCYPYRLCVERSSRR